MFHTAAISKPGPIRLESTRRTQEDSARPTLASSETVAGSLAHRWRLLPCEPRRAVSLCPSGRPSGAACALTQTLKASAPQGASRGTVNSISLSCKMLERSTNGIRKCALPIALPRVSSCMHIEFSVAFITS